MFIGKRAVAYMSKEMKHLPTELKVMQAWPLAKKIQVTQARIIEFYQHFGGNVYVSISGGKDSAVLLDLARRCYPGIEAVYAKTGLDFPEVQKIAINTPNVTVLTPKLYFPEVVQKYGWCYPSKEVAKIIYYARKGSGWACDRLAGINADGTASPWKKIITRGGLFY
jgi:3'-phosphoadenosine 5'-phosphosulfate sulfotransferase (PAPS reductase)/FAD synthetase